MAVSVKRHAVYDVSSLFSFPSFCLHCVLLKDSVCDVLCLQREKKDVFVYPFCYDIFVVVVFLNRN